MGKTATKRDDYTRLQNLNALFSVIGSVSTGGNRAASAYTLLYGRMMTCRAKCPTVRLSIVSSRWCAFIFPTIAIFITPTGMHAATPSSLWVHASVLEFIESFKGSMRGIILVSGIRETLSSGRRWTARKEKRNTRNYAPTLKIW